SPASFLLALDGFHQRFRVLRSPSGVSRKQAIRNRRFPMDLSAHRIAGAMRSAQALYDLAEPDSSIPWTETVEGDGWLEASIAELLARRDVKLAGRVIVTARLFIA